MSLLTIAQEVAGEVGVDIPSTIANNNDDVAKRLLYLVNAEGKRLSRRYNWQALIVETSFTTVAAELQGALTTIIGSDFDRFIPSTMYNRSDGRELVGSQSPRDWAFALGRLNGGIYDKMRIRGNNLYIYPAPPAGDSIYVEYFSKNWAKSSGGTGKSSMTIDTDESLLPEDLVTMGVKWRFLKSQGFDYDEEKHEYEKMLLHYIGTDTTGMVVDMSGGDEYPLSVGLANGSMPK